MVRDVEVVNLTCKKSQTAWTLRAFPKAPVRDVRIESCTFDNAAKASVAENVERLVVEGVTVNAKRVLTFCGTERSRRYRSKPSRSFSYWLVTASQE